MPSLSLPIDNMAMNPVGLGGVGIRVYSLDPAWPAGRSTGSGPLLPDVAWAVVLGAVRAGAFSGCSGFGVSFQACFALSPLFPLSSCSFLPQFSTGLASSPREGLAMTRFPISPACPRARAAWELGSCGAALGWLVPQGLGRWGCGGWGLGWGKREWESS